MAQTLRSALLTLAVLPALAAHAQPVTAAPIQQGQAQAGSPESPDTHTSSLWSHLWRTADQRGQALLQQGDAVAAAKEFSDPEHKAHAALQAGDYASAARTLQGIDTAEGQYNRGNALAHAGDLPGAIKAYDAALQHNPQHRDARHNRDLVAAALQKQKDDKKDEKKDNAKQDNKSGDKPGDPQDAKSDAKPGDPKDGKPGDKSAGQQDATSASKSGDKPGQKPGDKPDNQPAAKPGDRPASAPQPDKAGAPSAPASAVKDEAAQARRDAEAALNKDAQRGASSPGLGLGTSGAGKDRSAQTASGSAPITEKQIAQEQWLRAIPDDPGGLLRRKFLIEHMLRQQGQKP